ncbi:MAG: 2-amino-4-hydroxy-6-hydroxymethyldihydropteridine diphosphokinase [Deltaproteobacteria bacterium GWB2_65_81]|nr:MAG: 2-amino-4-hydroxy-6-hydroxymethyldihydropteridine diphosphokinase [Deltaproteobacteria bacterium GWA2_65_63]OGP25875.1 MAG: 2-amino-4-hydroxy-6-hydroxymethyldihydropteridine diphosphokinase [Deltaproteobacteria bacterium GWB2_65_81]OGP38301.1 MAG: 2-amino-4-hydroxy-6-hydroxymethyldihydropteridine diphosphokinase [Deltaproteobacteria bacterium GWC2_66_88]
MSSHCGKECPPTREAVLLLGSNQGRRVRRIRDAVDRISGETELLAVSRMYASEPSGRSGQPWFLNLAIRAAVTQSPWELLGMAKRLEREAGRRGGCRWGPRTLDVDIILLGDSVVDQPGLVIPHASMARRRFCLLPVAEVAPEAVVPTYVRTVTQLLESCEDPLEVIAL